MNEKRIIVCPKCGVVLMRDMHYYDDDLKECPLCKAVDPFWDSYTIIVEFSD